MSARSDAVQQQINEMRGSALAIREGIEKTTEQANDWQRKANDARKLVAVLEEKARIWDALADALDSGRLHDIAAPLEGRYDRPTRTAVYALQGRLMAQLADYELDAWNMHGNELRVMLHRLHGGSRAVIAEIADRLNIKYVERPHSEGHVTVTAQGEIDGIDVEIWSLLPDDPEPTDNGGALNDAEPDLVGAMARHSSAHGTAAAYDMTDPHDAALAEQARAEHVDYAEAEAVREIEREMAIEAGDDSEIDRQVAEDDARNEREYEAHEANEAWLVRDAESEA